MFKIWYVLLTSLDASCCYKKKVFKGVMEREFQRWCSHKNVAALNHFMGSQPFPFNKYWLKMVSLMNITNKWKHVVFAERKSQ